MLSLMPEKENNRGKGGAVRVCVCMSVCVFAHSSAQVEFVLNGGHRVTGSKREKGAMSNKSPDQRADHSIAGSDMTRGP